jgi:hypothetical protein
MQKILTLTQCMYIYKKVSTTGCVPLGRYRTSLVVHEDTMVLFGGHNGTSQLNDCYVYHFIEKCWRSLVTEVCHHFLLPPSEHIYRCHV